MLRTLESYPGTPGIVALQCELTQSALMLKGAGSASERRSSSSPSKPCLHLGTRRAADALSRRLNLGWVLLVLQLNIKTTMHWKSITIFAEQIASDRIVEWALLVVNIPVVETHLLVLVLLYTLSFL